MDQQGAEPSLKRTCTRPSYVRYFLSDGVGFILSLPPDIRRHMTSRRYWTKHDCLMVAMAHFECNPYIPISAGRIRYCQERSALRGSCAQFVHFSKRLPFNDWDHRKLQLFVARNGDVGKMKFIQITRNPDTSRFKLFTEKALCVASCHGKVEMMRHLGLKSSDDRYSCDILGWAAVGGHLNAFDECMRNLKEEDLFIEKLWCVYKELIRHGHLHVIEWLEKMKGRKCIYEMHWRYFNEDFDYHGCAEYVAIKYGHTHILDWALKNGMTRLAFDAFFECAVYRKQQRCIDWAFDNYKPSLEILSAEGATVEFHAPGVLNETVRNGQYDIAKHLFQRGVQVNTTALEKLLPLVEWPNAISEMSGFLSMLLDAENDPEKYKVSVITYEPLGYDRFVQVRHPSSAHFKK
jgi:hypothetical protein